MIMMVKVAKVYVSFRVHNISSANCHSINSSHSSVFRGL
jgi:hypothetical protein